MSFTKDDLIQKCSDCDGLGVIRNPPTDSNQRGFGIHRTGFSNERDCLRCHRTGEIFTEAGEAIADVVALLQRQNRLR